MRMNAWSRTSRGRRSSTITESTSHVRHESNNLIKGTEFENTPLEGIIVKASGGSSTTPPRCGITRLLALPQSERRRETERGSGDAIKKTFGSVDEFKKQFSQTGDHPLWSGWGWLVKNPDGSLALNRHATPGTPITEGKDCDTDLRCVGTCLLHRLSKRSAPVCRELLEPGQLGVRCQEFWGADLSASDACTPGQRGPITIEKGAPE